MSEILERNGIIPLTGEACSLMMRLLCDLTPQGCEIMNKFLGGNVEFVKGSNWNSSQGQVASIMIPYSCLEDLRKFVTFIEKGRCDRNTHQMSGRVI